MSLIAAILAHFDIVAVIEEYGVNLRRQGGRLVGLCPFHDERTPSFTVYAERAEYHCFGCTRHGDLINFVAEIERITIREAIHRLAAQAGLRRSPGGSAAPTPAPAEPLPLEAVPRNEQDLAFVRAARKAEFDRLALVLSAADQRCELAARNVTMESLTEEDLDRLQAAYVNRDAVVAEISAFWQLPGFVDFHVFRWRFLEVTGSDDDPVDVGITEQELAVLLLRPGKHPDSQNGAGEWLEWLQPIRRDLLELIREKMRAPLTRAEIDNALAWHRDNNPRFARNKDPDEAPSGKPTVHSGSAVFVTPTDATSPKQVTP